MKKIKFNKKAQVTLFAIVGALLLLSAVLYFVILNKLSQDKPAIDIPDVSLEARPAVTIVKSCLEDVALEALDKIGKQGGMLNPPEISYPPYRGEALLDGPNTIPYWRYLDDCDNPNGCEEINIPPLCKPGECYGQPTGPNSIQEQLENYVVDNIDSCIDEFSAIESAYDVKKNGEPKVQVIFNEGRTDFLLNYPLIITSLTTDNTVTYDLYLEEIDVDLANMYALAQDIIRFERSTNYYERQTMNLVNIYSGLDSDLLPPTSEVDFQFKSFIPWVSFDVKETLKYDLLPFMNLITFPNVDNFVYIQEPGATSNTDNYVSRGIYSSFNPKISDEVYPYEVHHQYNYDEIFFQIDDGATVIKPRNMLDTDNSLLAKMTQLAIQDYRFNYFISYPLVIKISDPYANDYLGYDFQFAVEVNIRNNIPAYQNFTTINLEPTREAIGLADFEQRLPQNITIKTYDKWTQEPLTDVMISYVCGDEYALGTTDYDGEEASLTTTMPYCELGGFIKYDKVGYLGESIPYNNKLNGTNMDFSVELWPEHDKVIIVQKRSDQAIKDIQNAGTNALELYVRAAENISANQTAFVNVERIPTSPYDSIVPLPGFISIEGEGTDYYNIYSQEFDEIIRNYNNGFYNESTKDMLISLLNEQHINHVIYTEPNQEFILKMVPGTYTLDGSLIDKTGFTINEMNYDDYQAAMGEEQSLMGGLITGILMDTSDFNLPEQNFTTWLVGGVKTNFTITPAEVYNNQPLRIYMLEQPIPSNWPELANYKELEDYQKGKEYFIKPYVG
ncbi:hypothetical protein JXA48_03705 [Candidatus Woesearchaeota archaeon]|nr:hypothetical protein [Candidatus Woesearchaeota archaeon]